MATFDYDAFEAARTFEPVKVEGLYGQDWELPAVGRLPAREVLAVQRLAMALASEAREQGVDLDEDDVDDLPEGLMERALELMQRQRALYLGQENVDAWLERGMDDEALNAISAWAQAQHNAQDEPEEGEPEGEAAGA